MKEWKITKFADKLASNDPTPGGGAAAGVTASLGVSAILMAMKCSKTKKMSDANKAWLLEQIDTLEQSKSLFIELIDRDAKDFEPLAKAYRMPKSTEKELSARKEAIQQGLQSASQPPIEMLREIERIVKSLPQAVPLTKKVIISDLGVGTQLLRSALHTCSLNLMINAGQIKDAQLKQEYMTLAGGTVEQLSTDLDDVYHQVQTILTDT